MKKILRISAKREGYRRCGVAHTGAATDHPADDFDETQIETLKADPMLIVQELDAGAPADADAKGAKQAEIDRLLGEAKADRQKAAEELAAATKAREEAEAGASEAREAKPKPGKKG